jgi:hypothetical protein
VGFTLIMLAICRLRISIRYITDGNRSPENKRVGFSDRVDHTRADAAGAQTHLLTIGAQPQCLRSIV